MAKMMAMATMVPARPGLESPGGDPGSLCPEVVLVSLAVEHCRTWRLESQAAGTAWQLLLAGTAGHTRLGLAQVGFGVG